MDYARYLEELRDRVVVLMTKKHVTSVNYWAEEQLKSVNERINQPTVHRILTRNTKPTLEFVRSILELYPDVSAEWLIRGRGDIYDTNVQRVVDNETALRNMKLDLDMANGRIARQSEEIRELQAIIEKKNKIIEEFIR